MFSNIKNMISIDLVLLFLYVFFLPISHVATIQTITGILFVLYVIIKNKNQINLKALFSYKSLWIAFFVYTLLAFLSLFNTPSVIETLKEIKGEILERLFFMSIFFFYALSLTEKKLKKVIYVLFLVFIIHDIINILIWIKHGGWPYRAGGLLDSASCIGASGGERFGIWITYTFSLSISLIYINIHKWIGIFLLILSILSTIANQVRATFLGVLIVFLVYISIFNKKKWVKYTTALSITFLCIFFYFVSSKLPQRYNLQSIIHNLRLVFTLPPNKFNKIPVDPSVYERLSMWKSAILYRIKHPFVPQYFGRFLYRKSILKEFKNSPQNIPVHLYPQTHNDFIGTLHALGIFGLLAFIYFFYFNLKISYKLFKITKNSYEKAFGIFVFLGTIGFIDSIMFGSFFGDSEAKFFFFLYGLLLGIFYKYRIEKENAKV